MPTYTRAEWRRIIREQRPDLTEREVRAVAGLAHKRYESRLDDRPLDWRINGVTFDQTPTDLAREVIGQNDRAAMRRLGLIAA